MKRILLLLPCLALLACEGRRDDHTGLLATVNGEKITQGDFELLLNSLPSDRKDEIMKDSEAKRKRFNELLKQRLFALAAKETPLGQNASLQKRLNTLDQRIVTQYYFQTYLSDQGGFTLKELEAYYEQHPSQFMGDSNKVKPFNLVKAQITDSMILSHANLDSFFTTNKRKYTERAFCEVSLLQVKDKKSAENISGEINKGLAFKDAVKKYSTHSSKGSEGRLGRAYPGESMWELGSNLNIDSLLFNDETKVKIHELSKPFKKDSNWVVVRVDSCQGERIPDLTQIRRQVGEEFLTAYRSRLNDSALARLKAKYHVVTKDMKKINNPEAVKAYYDKNKDSYSMAETYEVYHIEATNRDAMARRLKAVKDLESFKKIAAQASENSWTKPNAGAAGIVKRDACFPYGIGMLPSAWSAFDTLSAGKWTGPFQNPETNKWHWFFLVQKFPRQIKPYDRVKALVQKDYQDDMIAQIKPDDTLATYEKGEVIREKDVLFLREEIPANMQERYTREALVDFLLTWELSTREAKALGLTDELKLQAQRIENVDGYWAGVYQDSVLAKTYALDTNEIKSVFAKNHNTITRDTSAHDALKFSRDIAGLKTLTENDFVLEYHTFPERYMHDSTAIPYDSSKQAIFDNLKGTAYVRAEKSLIETLKAHFKVEIHDADLLEPKISNPTESYKTAQNLHYDRKLDKALELYERLRQQFPDNAALQDSICFGVAQIYIEQERYQQAMSEYRRVSFLYPKSPNEYKAEFMVGFIQSEHLKNDSAAVRTFEAMLKKYPSSDLSDDADWMIRNIRSGGKLMPVLEGDSGYVAPDSTKPKADSSKVAAPATPATTPSSGTKNEKAEKPKSK